ncbi:hypothetical protein [Sunxiuqinia indica]|uniref:hypothetical protein n=1 Tax=Sunxiuqinia indica TaxID=2692584 RepID=UPI001358A197|nr:hypothetical protein [Sunxiuqinia indica]
MKRKILISFTAFLFLGLQSCWWSGSEDDTIWVYKTKEDYSDKVTIELSKDKTRITSFYGPPDVQLRWPEKLADGYYLNGTLGVNSAILSVTKEEYMKQELPFSIDSMFSLIIDNDPFLEFYQYQGNEFNIEGGFDTVRINMLIKNNVLTKYFDRMK